MNHKNYLITGIAIFFVLVMGGAGITYIFLTHQPAVATKPLTKMQHPRKSNQSPEKIPTPAHAHDTTKDSSRHSPDLVEKVETESGASLVHASTIYVEPSTTPNVTKQAFEVEKRKEEKLTLVDLQFGLSRTGLKTQTKTTLDAYAKRLRDPQWSVLIEGHTDETGSIRKNLHVGLQRANAVRQYLITKGISKDRLHAVSLGEYQPVCMDTTPACQLQNRRVSFALARREGIEKQNSVPVPQEPVTLSKKSAISIELVNLPEIHKSTIDTPGKVNLIYPDPVHHTPPPSIPVEGDN